MKKPKKTKTGKETSSRYVIGNLSVSLRGWGTVIDPNGKKRISIDPDFLGTALHGDTVKILVHPKQKNRYLTGEVKEILRKGRRGCVGKIIKEGDAFLVSPTDKRIHTEILIPKEYLSGSKEGDLVLCSISEWKSRRQLPIGEVERVLGKSGEHNAHMAGIALERGFVPEHEKDVVFEAGELERRGISEKEKVRRRDLREEKVFTIDPFDAKDFDDAIHIKDLGNETYEVGVHIADVSFFVTNGSQIDEEAYDRATSVYMVDRTIPMLPHVLSDNLCSLVEGQDRLTMSAIFNMDKHGNVLSEWFGETVIQSKKRFTYEEAQDSLEKGGILSDELKKLDEITRKLRDKRMKRGSIVAEQVEVKFLLDQKGVPISVSHKIHQRTNEIIEDLMLLANERVARFMTPKKKGMGIFVYRVHDTPDKERVGDLVSLLKHLGYKLEAQNYNKKEITPKDIERIVEEVHGTNEQDIINDLLIRSMAKAIYSTDNIGHFGLALSHYTHFTSPIRRYPDLVVHRLLKARLKGEKIPMKDLPIYEDICIHSSQRERDAQEAERTSIKWKQVEYIGQHKSETLEGTITGIMDWGIFVSDNLSKAEGVIRIEDLSDDEWSVDEYGTILAAKKSKKKLRLGDPIKIKAKEVDMDNKTIDFILAE